MSGWPSGFQGRRVAADDAAGFQAAIRDRDAVTLVRLYTGRADRCLGAGDEDAGCFYLTHAYIWALDGGLPEAPRLHARLKSLGRDV